MLTLLVTFSIFIPGSVADRRRTQRWRVTTLAQDNRLETSQMRNRPRPAERIAAVTIGIYRRPISGQTVRNRLRERGFRARRQFVGCVLTPSHRTARLNWCTLHRRWTRQQLANLLFSDESGFTLQSKDGRTRVHRHHWECYSDGYLNPVNHFQASVMV
jgi:hypothetical protein